jgi:hypothetical protein
MEPESDAVETTVNRISPRSALRVAGAMNAALFLVWMVAALVVFIVLGVSGVWGRMNSLLADLTGSDTVGAGTYFGVAAGVGLLEAVVVTLLAPVVAVLYNSVATLVGGLRVTVGAPDALGTVGTVGTATAPRPSQDAPTDSTVDGGDTGDGDVDPEDSATVDGQTESQARHAAVEPVAGSDRLAGWGLQNSH